MVAEINKIKDYIKVFGKEIHDTNIIYSKDLDMANEKSSQLINDIIKNGLEQNEILPYPKLEREKRLSYKELCDKFEKITLHYNAKIFGSELTWYLE